MRLVRVCEALILIVMFASMASAQGTTVNAVRGRISERMVVGSTTLGDVLRIVGSSTVSSGTGTMNPAVVDSDGDVLEDSFTTVSTAGAHTWSAAGQFSSTLGVTGATTLSSTLGVTGAATLSSTLAVTGNTTITGNLIGGSGNLLVTSPARFSGTALGLAAVGSDNVRIGINSDTPRLLFEDSAGAHQIQQDNVAGAWRLSRLLNTGSCDTAGCVPLQVDGNITVQPLGRRILPGEPYGVDLGSQQYKFGALWTGDLYADRLVTIENIGTIDNRWLIGNGNVLDEDLSPSATTMVTRYNNYATGTFVYLQKFARTEFIKTSSGPTLTNKVSNGSFETGAATNWSGSSATVAATFSKSFHGDNSMLVDASANPSFAAYGAVTFATGTTYTVCFNARRVDGAAMVNGDVAIFIRDSFVDALAQPTQTDGWYRFCRTAAAGSDATTFLSINTKGVDMYLDAVQIEETSVERPYSEYRASYTIARNQEGGSSVANQWYAGDGMFGVGAVSGDGWIDCYAIRGIKAATEQGPACVVNVRTGSSYNSWAPRTAWGNLDGLYGYSGTTYGFAAGDSSAAWIGFDSTNGLRGMYSSTQKFGINMSGVASFTEGAITIDDDGITIFNSTNAWDNVKSYRFAGAITYGSLQPGVFYLESGGNGSTVLTSGVRASGTDTTSVVGDEVFFITHTGVGIDVRTSTNTMNFGAPTITVDTNSTVTSNLSCSAGQAVKAINVYKGWVLSVSCGAP